MPLHRNEQAGVVAGELAADRGRRREFTEFSRLLCATVRAGFQRELQRLKFDYLPFDPDEDIKSLVPLSEEMRRKRLHALFDDFARLLERANYTRLSRDEIVAATPAPSVWGVNMD